jgi:predicted O-linked N-acetylglucosamine transferase (SPINDLY family)
MVQILIDLNGYTSGTRLLAFALRPAPLQITWYPAY